MTIERARKMIGFMSQGRFHPKSSKMHQNRRKDGSIDIGLHHGSMLLTGWVLLLLLLLLLAVQARLPIVWAKIPQSTLFERGS
jgi:hypothetical protein